MRNYIVIFFLLQLHFLGAQVQINEMMADNESFLITGHQGFPDWIELYNNSDTIVCLKNWKISDDEEEREKWIFPDTCLLPDDHLIVACTGISSAPLLSTNFKLSSSGERITLTDHHDSVIDAITFPPLSEDQTFGRSQNIGSWSILRTATPGALNSTTAYYGDRLITIKPDNFFYQSDLKVNVTVSDSCDDVHINFEGRNQDDLSNWTKTNSQFELPQTQLNPYYALFPTSLDFKPSNTLKKYHQVSVNCYDEHDLLISQKRKTYIDQKDALHTYDLPVAFLELSESDLFHDEYGIMVYGDDQNYSQEGREWERPARLNILFDEKTLLQSNVGVRIHGHATRELPQKSLKIYFRSEYDTTRLPGKLIDIPFDPDRLIFRSFHSNHVGNEFTDFGFTDDVIMDIVQGSNRVLAQKSRPMLVFINGEFWGIYSLHEASDDDFIAQHHQISTQDVELYTGANAMSLMMEEFLKLDFSSPSDRAILESSVDIENLIDYLIFQTFFMNIDWPHNNIKFWRSKAVDNRFRFIIFDMDATFKNARENYFTRFFSENGFSPRFESKQHAFFAQFMSSSHYLAMMQKRYFELRKDVLSPSNMLTKLQSYKEQISPYIDDQTNRWHYPKNRRTWESAIEEIEQFLITRHLTFANQVLSLNPPKVYPNPLLGNSLTLDPGLDDIFSSLSISDLQGRTLLEMPLIKGNDHIEIPVYKLVAGTYLLSWKGEQIMYQSKLVIQ